MDSEETFVTKSKKYTREEQLLDILRATKGELSTQELKDISGIYPSNFSRTIRPLIDAGQVFRRQEGNRAFFSAKPIRSKPKRSSINNSESLIKQIPPLQNYLNDLKLEGDTKDTLRQYGYKGLRFFKFLSGPDRPKFSIRPIATITKLDIKKYFKYCKEERHNSGRTLQLIWKALNPFFKYCVKEGYIIHNPMSDIKMPKAEEKEPVDFTMSEFEQMLAVATTFRDKVLLHFLLASGARCIEVGRFTINDIFSETNEIRLFGKGNKERIIPIAPKVIQMLQEYINEYRGFPRDPSEGAVFLNLHHKTRLNRDMIQITVREIRGQAKITKKITPHSFRHTCARLLDEGGMSIRQIQYFLGHSNIATTEKYIKVLRTVLRYSYQKAHPLAGGTKIYVPL